MEWKHLAVSLLVIFATPEEQQSAALENEGIPFPVYFEPWKLANSHQNRNSNKDLYFLSYHRGTGLFVFIGISSERQSW